MRRPQQKNSRQQQSQDQQQQRSSSRRHYTTAVPRRASLPTTADGASAAAVIMMASVILLCASASFVQARQQGPGAGAPLFKVGKMVTVNREVISVLTPGGRCSSGGTTMSQCSPGWSCRAAAAGSKHTSCQLDPDVYDTKCPTTDPTKLLKLGQKCGGLDTALGLVVARPGCCCPLGLVCKNVDIADTDMYCQVANEINIPRIDTSAPSPAGTGRKLRLSATGYEADDITFSASGSLSSRPVGRTLTGFKGVQGGRRFRSIKLKGGRSVRICLRETWWEIPKRGRGGFGRPRRHRRQPIPPPVYVPGKPRDDADNDFPWKQDQPYKAGNTQRPANDSCVNRLWDFAPYVCDCYDATPDCRCSPFKGLNLTRVPKPIKTYGNKLVDSEGKVVTLNGLNWFGFETTYGFLQALWLGDYDDRFQFVNCMGNDISLVAYRLRLLGFNAIRLPFLFTQLGKDAADVNSYLEKDCFVPTIKKFKELTLPPELKGNPDKYELPFAYNGWKCSRPEKFPYMSTANWYVPASRGNNDPKTNRDPRGFTVLDRFKWVVQHFVAQGFYVVLDYHPNDNNLIVQEQAIFSSRIEFAKQWAWLLNEFTSLKIWNSALKGRVLIDLGNEFDKLRCDWEKKSKNPPWDVNSVLPNNYCAPYSQLLLTAIEKIKQIDADTIILFEGLKTNTNADRCSAWGDGFQLDPADTGSSATSFFDNAPVDASLVLSPHIYCRQAILDWECSNVDAEKYFQSSWLGKKDVGYKDRKYPVIIGEIGAGFGGYSFDSTNRLNQAKFPLHTNTAWFNLDTDFPNGPPQDDLPKKLKPCMDWLSVWLRCKAKASGVFWWSYNYNSGDTGGLVDFPTSDKVAGPKSDTQKRNQGVALKWYKLKWMYDALPQMKPWWKWWQPLEVRSCNVIPTFDDSISDNPLVDKFGEPCDPIGSKC